MRKIIDGRVYDTTTAELICDVSAGNEVRNDFNYDSTDLYRTKNGRFFIAGEGGAASRWRRQSDQNAWGAGSGMKLIDEDEAKRLVEHHADAGVWIATFGMPEEG